MPVKTLEGKFFIAKIGTPFELVPISKIPDHNNLLYVEVCEEHRIGSSGSFSLVGYKGEIVQRRGENKRVFSVSAPDKTLLFKRIRAKIKKEIHI